MERSKEDDDYQSIESIVPQSKDQNGIHGTINLNDAVESSTADLSGQVHLIPCSVKFDGVSSISHYFRPKPTDVEVEGLKIEEAHFRGRKLQGTSVSLPHGFSGYVLGKKSDGKRKAMSEAKENCWETNAKFKNITFWKHDSVPSQNDTFLRSLHWLAVAKAMHEPVGSEDMVSASIALEKLK